MKSAYELAMERLDQSTPQVKLSDEQKAEIANIDNKFKAKKAEKEVFLNGLIEKAKMSGTFEELSELQDQLTREVAGLEADCEAAKEKVRNAGS